MFNRESEYVAASRATDNTEIVTSDAATVIKNAGKDVSKSTALDGPELTGLFTARRDKLREEAISPKTLARPAPGRTLSF